MLNKVHWIRDANVGPTKVTTHCGMTGWRSSISDEYETELNRRFEASARLGNVDCKRCVASARRISET